MERGSGSATMEDEEDEETLRTTTDAELLKRAWRSEKAAPEILQFEDSLVLRSREQIQLQEGTVEEYVNDGADPLTVSLYQMDLDRTLFLLRSYLRTRLQKIEKYMMHIRKSADAPKTDMAEKSTVWNRLSMLEQKFARRCIDDLEEHFDKSILSALPAYYKSSSKQSNISEEDDMVPEPNLDTYVICRTQRSLGPLQLDASGEEEPVDLDPNNIYAVRYNVVKPLVYSKKIDLV